jgi:hypothetical protein
MMVGLAWWVYETLVVSPNRRFESRKRSQLLIRTHNETLSVVAMCVSDEDCSPVGIYCCNAAPTPAGFAEIQAIDGWPINPHRT